MASKNEALNSKERASTLTNSILEPVLADSSLLRVQVESSLQRFSPKEIQVITKELKSRVSDQNNQLKTILGRSYIELLSCSELIRDLEKYSGGVENSKNKLRELLGELQNCDQFIGELLGRLQSPSEPKGNGPIGRESPSDLNQKEKSLILVSGKEEERGGGLARSKSTNSKDPSEERSQKGEKTRKSLQKLLIILAESIWNKEFQKAIELFMENERSLRQIAKSVDDKRELQSAAIAEQILQETPGQIVQSATSCLLEKLKHQKIDEDHLDFEKFSNLTEIVTQELETIFQAFLLDSQHPWTQDSLIDSEKHEPAGGSDGSLPTRESKERQTLCFVAYLADEVITKTRKDLLEVEPFVKINTVLAISLSSLAVFQAENASSLSINTQLSLLSHPLRVIENGPLVQIVAEEFVRRVFSLVINEVIGVSIKNNKKSFEYFLFPIISHKAFQSQPFLFFFLCLTFIVKFFRRIARSS